MPDVVILCGGKGTRAYPDTLELPKPLLPVADIPIVEHVMRIYAAAGHTRFILAVGYLGELIAERYTTPPAGWEVEIVETGAETETGERLRLAAAHAHGDRFFATYADGLANLDVNSVLDDHVASGALATVTTVPLPSQYGILESEPGGRITRFQEKPRLADHWINGGFFVIERTALDVWEGEVLERDVLPALAARGELHAYRHHGFWKSMDTYKDRQELATLAEAGDPPWAVPERESLVRALADDTWIRAATTDQDSALVLAGGRSSGAATAAPILEQHAGPIAATAEEAPSVRGRRTNFQGNGSPGRTGSPGGNGSSGKDVRDGTAGANGEGEASAVPDREGSPAARLAARAFLPPPRRQATRRTRIVAGASAVIDLGNVVLAYLLVGSISGGPLGARLVGSDEPILLTTVPLWILAFAAYGLYERRKLVASSEEARRILQGTALGAVLLVLVTFAVDLPVARSWVAVLSLVTLLAVSTGRVLVRAAAQMLATRGIIGQRVLVIGSNGEAHHIARTLDRKRWLGYCPVGFVATGDGDEHENGLPLVGTVDAIAEAVELTDAGAAVIASTSLPADSLGTLCARLEGLGVDVRVSPGLPHVSASRVSVAPLDGLAVLSVRASNQLSRTQRSVKRAVDVSTGLVLLALSAPVVGTLALLIRLTSGSPAIFRQVRVGEGGRPFLLFKLRTMVPDAEHQVIDLRDDNEADGLLFKLADDPRVTRIGRFLRRWALDELPQFWNVVRGDMSLVGPRPPLPEETDRYDAWIRGRLKVKPGLTGLWQVNGGHVLGFDDYVRYDLFYVENWSLGLDLYVLARTPPALLLRRGMA